MAVARSSKLSSSKRRWRLRWILAAIAAVLLIAAVFVIRPFWSLSGHFDEVTFRQPSRLYGRATRLFEGRNFPPEMLIASLADEGYREDKTSKTLPAGRYRRGRGQEVAIHLRSFLLPDGSHGGGLIRIGYQGTHIADLRRDGRATDSVILDPPLLASYYGKNLLERRPVTLDEVSPDLIASILAAEDETFFGHAGVSLTGTLRAVWVDLRGKGVRQGGSTLTQQLVKNLYLTQERTLTRKSQEILLAVLLEMRYSKKKILEAYLNEIYLGGGNGVSLIGVGAASRAYFGKDADQLDLAEAATLAGIIPSPANYSPITHPDKAKARRDWVLGRLASLGLVPQARVDAALAEPIAAAPEPVVRRRAPYFADSAALEASRRFGVEDLEDGGYVLFSTLDWTGQKAAQEAVESGLKEIDGGHRTRSLQAALVSMDPATGGILAYIGGRGYDASQFDRAGQAQRQPGSSFKPVVYAAAFEAGKASPASFLEDEPISVPVSGGQVWSPKNDDDTYHGWVSVRTALEKSYNPATTRLALEVGMPKIVKLAHDMGITTPMEPFPAMALGAAAVTPLEMATVYSTLAGGGSRPPVHELVAVLDHSGKVVQGAPAAETGAGDLAADRLPGDLAAPGGAPARHRRRRRPRDPRRARGQDRHHQQAAGRLVRRLRAGAHHGRLGGLRRQRQDPPLRRPRRPADLGPLHGEGRAAGRLLHLRPAPRHHHGGDRSHHRHAGDRALPRRAHRGLPRGRGPHARPATATAAPPSRRSPGPSRPRATRREPPRYDPRSVPAKAHPIRSFFRRLFGRARR